MAQKVILSLVVAVFAAHSGLVMPCSFPPEMWCSSEDISKTCHVEQQCAEWNSPIKDAAKVNFTLYYESYCPGCQGFINGQLHDAYEAVGEIMNLTMIPFGNALEKKKGNKYVFECQHGKIECRGNLIETCILHYTPYPTAFETIYCMEVTHRPVHHAEKCMKKMQVDSNQIFACANGSLGNELEHQMALKTDALNPPHQYVPWVTLNGVHNAKIQNEAQTNLKKLICDTYQGAKPPACSQEKSQSQSCNRE